MSLAVPGGPESRWEGQPMGGHCSDCHERHMDAGMGAGVVEGRSPGMLDVM